MRFQLDPKSTSAMLRRMGIEHQVFDERPCHLRSSAAVEAVAKLGYMLNESMLLLAQAHEFMMKKGLWGEETVDWDGETLTLIQDIKTIVYGYTEQLAQDACDDERVPAALGISYLQ